MPRHRPPRSIWFDLRRQVWLRDEKHCQGPYCRDKGPLELNRVHIDHIKSGKLATNALAGLRTLCRRCHALRLDPRHRGMIASALEAGLIPADWRQFCWDDGEHWPSEETVAKLNRWVAAQEENRLNAD